MMTELRDRIDRACRVVQALSMGIADMEKWGTDISEERRELDWAMRDVLQTRARERELMAARRRTEGEGDGR